MWFIPFRLAGTRLDVARLGVRLVRHRARTAGTLAKRLGPLGGALRLAFQRNGNQLDISWPPTGGHLEAQTNSLSVGLGTNWGTLPGSAATNHVVVPLDPSNGSVFYRLAVP